MAADDTDLIAALCELRLEFETWGYRKLTGVLKERGWQVNHKKVYRIWNEQGWQRRAPRRRKAKHTGDSSNACHIRRTEYGSTGGEGGQDDGSEVRARGSLDRGVPEFVRSDNGGEFAGGLLKDALEKMGSKVALNAPGSPWQNGKNERFNGILSQELLSRKVWGNLLEAQVLCEQWRQRYNEVRPHGSLGMKTPSSYAKLAREEGRWRLDEPKN